MRYTWKQQKDLIGSDVIGRNGEVKKRELTLFTLNINTLDIQTKIS